MFKKLQISCAGTKCEKMRSKEILDMQFDNADKFSLQVAENKRPDPSQYQLTSDGKSTEATRARVNKSCFFPQ